MARKNKGWLTGVGIFTAIIFGTLAYVSYRAYGVRGEGYYLASVAVYGGVALFSLIAVVSGWLNRLPGQRQQQDMTAEATEGNEPPPA